jgi:ABC-type nitrate/sulfonate/bicarbonate transport system substrate-binding protein
VSLVPVIHLELQHPGSVRVFSQSRSTPDRASDSIVVRGDAPLHALSDLEGRKMGVFPGTSATRLLSAFLAREGVETDNITFVPLPPASHLSALESQSVDALFTYEPTTTVARVSGRFRTLHGSVYASLLNPSPLGAAIVSRRFEQERPLVARRTIAAFDDAVEYMRRHEAQAKELIPRFLTLQVELARQVTVVESGLSSENDVQALQRLIDLLHAVGELPAVFDAEQLVELGP